MQQPEWLKSVYHAGTSDYLSNTCPVLGESLVVRLRVHKKAPIQQIVLRTVPNGEQQFTSMTRVEADGDVQYWQATLTVNEPLTHYRFGLQTEEAIWWFNPAGISLQVPFNLFDFKLVADFHTIPWLQDAIFYQIFPDRFENGDPANDPQREPVGYRNIIRHTYPWGQPLPKDEENMLAFYGGDLQGIIQRLDHLEALGVNALYLNPVFTAFSNHRYDVVDYDAVDPVLGGDHALIELRRLLHEKQMHYILDIVPNHCGYGHPWFQQAQADAGSLEAGFFYFDHHPEHYESWMGRWSLPKLNYASAELRQRMYKGEQSIIRRWLRPPFAADGWRVDVANMLGRRNAEQLDGEIIPDMRKAVKHTNPDAYLVGENFFEASTQLQGNGWDGVMNYAGFSNPLWYWLCKYEQGSHGWAGALSTPKPWPTETLVRSWLDHLAAIPWQIALQQFNVLDSHDTPRMRTLLNDNDALHRLAVVLQFTFPGVPCVYYGDEIGLIDEEGFGSRNCMPWDEQEKWNQDLLDFYKKLIAFRKHNKVLSEGSFQILYWDEEFLIYQRLLGQNHILVTANRSNQPFPPSRITLPNTAISEESQFSSLFTGQSAVYSGGVLTLPECPQGSAIWHLN